MRAVASSLRDPASIRPITAANPGKKAPRPPKEVNRPASPAILPALHPRRIPGRPENPTRDQKNPEAAVCIVGELLRNSPSGRLAIHPLCIPAISAGGMSEPIGMADALISAPSREPALVLCDVLKHFFRRILTPQDLFRRS